MTGFSLTSPSRVVFGAGKIAELAAIVSELAPPRSGAGTVLVLSDKGVAGTGRPAAAAAALSSAGYATRVVDEVPPEPSDLDLDAIAVSLKGVLAVAIVAIGGGSVMDAAKVLSALASTGWTTAQLAARGVPSRGAPLVMVPTTAGTGAEATPNAIVLFPERNLKIGIVSPHFIPERVILDPMLTLGLPSKLTASTGVDAFCHLLECFISKKANPASDMMAREGMRMLIGALPAAYADGTDLEARSAAM
ncbi:MAG: iron-containing alcohol dehydrogenase, partial [Spirochaetaceae bacterium]|nr:iron-containing alcohol dehydrogenase [Spirochaetaceae bacterium]